MADSIRRSFIRLGAATAATVLGAALVTSCSKVPDNEQGGTLQRIQDAIYESSRCGREIRFDK